MTGRGLWPTALPSPRSSPGRSPPSTPAGSSSGASEAGSASAWPSRGSFGRSGGASTTRPRRSRSRSSRATSRSSRPSSSACRPSRPPAARARIAMSLRPGALGSIRAELRGGSAVIAAVTAGVYLGWHTPELTNAQVRIQATGVWEIVQSLLTALLFVLIGLQLPVVLDALGDYSPWTLFGYAALVSGAVIALRFAWVFAVLQAPKWIARRMSSWRGAVFVSW